MVVSGSKKHKWGCGNTRGGVWWSLRLAEILSLAVGFGFSSYVNVFTFNLLNKKEISIMNMWTIKQFYENKNYWFPDCNSHKNIELMNDNLN